jgi:hypothetical protein
MTVAGLIELFVAGLSDPVAYHGAIHLPVIVYSNVVFATAIIEVILRESPVATKRYKALSVDVELQTRINIFVSDLTDARLII